MAFNVNEIKAQLEFGGARPTLFQVQIINPADGAADIKSTYPFDMIRTRQIVYGETWKQSMGYTRNYKFMCNGLGWCIARSAFVNASIFSMYEF